MLNSDVLTNNPGRRRMGIGVGTPQRLSDLVDSGEYKNINPFR